MKERNAGPKAAGVAVILSVVVTAACEDSASLAVTVQKLERSEVVWETQVYDGPDLPHEDTLVQAVVRHTNNLPMRLRRSRDIWWTGEQLWILTPEGSPRVWSVAGEITAELAWVARQGHDGVFGCDDGKIIGLSQRNRLELLDKFGRVTEVIEVPIGATDSGARIMGLSSTCERVLMANRKVSIPPPSETSNFLHTLYWFETTTRSRDTLSTLRGWEVAARFIAGMPQPLVVPWSPNAHWTVESARDRVYWGVSARPSIFGLTPNGVVEFELRWSPGPAKVQREAKRDYERRAERWEGRMPQLGELLLPLKKFDDLPEREPAFAGLLASEGKIWVRYYPRGLSGRPDVFDWGAELWDDRGGHGMQDRWLMIDVTTGESAVRYLWHAPAGLIQVE